MSARRSLHPSLILRQLLRVLGQILTDHLDLIGVALLLVMAQPLVPTGHLLARDDLVPWIALTATLVALVRGGPLGPGGHPALTARRSRLDALARRLGVALVPAALMSWYDAGSRLELSQAVMAATLSGASGLLLLLGRDAGRTAWRPPGFSASLWVIGVPFFALLAAATGLLASLTTGTVLDGVFPGGLLCLQLLGVGLAAGRTVNLRQRRAAGRRDGGSAWPIHFPMALAAVGPAAGFAGLTFAWRLVAGHALTFGEAYVAVLIVTAWGAILWRRPTPVAVGVVLHEVTPAGGGDSSSDGAAVAFDRPPEGALRFNPLRLTRTRVVHPWIVPVRRSRIGDLDDPVSPLWAPPPALASAHVLNDAACEPDPLTGAPQHTVITLRPSGGGDTVALSDEDAQTRRIVILRAFPRLGSRGGRLATYLWQEEVPAECVQVLDASVEVCQLIDGDVIVLSLEGVARAYEVEIGQPILPSPALSRYRLPQIEDYVGVTS